MSEPLESAPEAAHGSGFLRGLREIAIVVVTALVISAVVRTFLLQAFWVPSGSMEETLMRGDRILVWKPGVDPGHGDVVVFKDPADWLADPIPVGGSGGHGSGGSWGGGGGGGFSSGGGGDFGGGGASGSW